MPAAVESREQPEPAHPSGISRSHRDSTTARSWVMTSIATRGLSPEELAYLVPRDGVEVGGDFVQDHHLRPARERPRQGETLELASRELGGIPALPAVGKADEACALLDAEPGSLPFGAEPGGRLTARPLDGSPPDGGRPLTGSRPFNRSRPLNGRRSLSYSPVGRGPLRVRAAGDPACGRAPEGPAQGHGRVHRRRRILRNPGERSAPVLRHIRQAGGHGRAVQKDLTGASLPQADEGAGDGRLAAARGPRQGEGFASTEAEAEAAYGRRGQTGSGGRQVLHLQKGDPFLRFQLLCVGEGAVAEVLAARRAARLFRVGEGNSIALRFVGHGGGGEPGGGGVGIALRALCRRFALRRGNGRGNGDEGNGPQEAGRGGRGGRGRPGGAVAHDECAVGQAGRDAGVVGDDDETRPQLGREDGDVFDDGVSGGLVQAGGGLVEDEDAGPCQQDPRERDAAALTPETSAGNRLRNRRSAGRPNSSRAWARAPASASTPEFSASSPTSRPILWVGVSALAGSWHRRPMDRRTAMRAFRPTGRPSRMTGRPATATSPPPRDRPGAIWPSSASDRVVLPLPDSPTSATRSPRPSSRPTSSRMGRSPADTLSPRIRTAGEPSPPPRVASSRSAPSRRLASAALPRLASPASRLASSAPPRPSAASTGSCRAASAASEPSGVHDRASFRFIVSSPSHPCHASPPSRRFRPRGG